MRIQFYGCLADAIDRQVELEARAESTVDQIRGLLKRAHPGAAAALAQSRAVIGDEAVENSRVLGPNDTLEFLPPVCGG